MDNKFKTVQTIKIVSKDDTLQDITISDNFDHGAWISITNEDGVGLILSPDQVKALIQALNRFLNS